MKVVIVGDMFLQNGGDSGAHPEHPIVIPPGAIGPGVPTHPIVLPPPVPSHPIVIPPDAIGPGVPSHPIVLPPYYPSHPIVIPPDSIDEGTPSHPIYIPYPPTPEHPIVIPPPSGAHPSHPIHYPDAHPEHPIVNPPIQMPPGGVPLPPAVGVPIDGKLVFIPGYGWTFIPDKNGVQEPPAKPE